MYEMCYFMDILEKNIQLKVMLSSDEVYPIEVPTDASIAELLTKLKEVSVLICYVIV